jgi:recombination protein RecA
VRLDIRRQDTIKNGTESIGVRTKVKVVKNKVAAPFREAEFDIMFDSGISKEGDLIDLADKHDVIKKSGAWFSYKDVRLGQGRQNVKTFLRDNSDLFEEIRAAVLAKETADAIKPATGAAVTSVADDAEATEDDGEGKKEASTKSRPAGKRRAS